MTKRFSLGFDWRNSPPHVLFLQGFLKMRPADDRPPLPLGYTWSTLLQEQPQEAIQRFLAQGALLKASLTQRMERYFTISQLKQMARQRDLSTAGLKPALIARLIEADTVGMYEEMPDTTLLTCSDYGRRQIEAYLSEPETAIRLADPEMAAVTATTITWSLIEGMATEEIEEAATQLLFIVDEPAARALKGSQSQEEPVAMTRVAPDLNLEWCYVPAGRFLMGSVERDRDAAEDEIPRHPVYVPAFYLGKYPVTNRQYATFVQATGHSPPSCWGGEDVPRGETDHPARDVSWSDAMAFCRWAARSSGLPIRLLTEAEWEKGARGDRGYRFPWGNAWRSNRGNMEEKLGGTTPVDAYPEGASSYGAHDMAGNVREWTHSLYRPYPYQVADGREEEDAEGARVARGGTWRSEARGVRAACRYAAPPDDDLTGFRVGWWAPYSLATAAPPGS